jgi:hypothetical protein
VEHNPLRLDLVTPLASLPEFERDVLRPLFPGGARHSTEASLRAAWEKPGFDPDQHLAAVSQKLAPVLSPASLLGPVAGLLLASGLVLQIRGVREVDLAPFLFLADFAMVPLFAGFWPRGWWHIGRPARSSLVGLLLPLMLISTAVVALLLSTERPLPAEAGLGIALVGLASYAAVLRGVKLRPSGTARARLSALLQIRRHAAAELRRPQPALDDAWIPALSAMGLEREIQRWRERQSRLGPGARSLESSASTGGRAFTGRSAHGAAGPAGWARALRVDPAWLLDDDDDEEEDGRGGRGR